ncbi:MAG: hypothetical protein H0X33_13260 [Taibaiella sp.]|nr:hypothetical protein [Taibaiella sp.]
MSGLKRGYLYDDWHPTKKYELDAKKEIEFGFETYEELYCMSIEDYQFLIGNDSHLENKYFEFGLDLQSNK